MQNGTHSWSYPMQCKIYMYAVKSSSFSKWDKVYVGGEEKRRNSNKYSAAVTTKKNKGICLVVRCTACTDIQRRSQNLRHFYSGMGLKLGYLGCSGNQNKLDLSGANVLRSERKYKHVWNAARRAKIVDAFCLCVFPCEWSARTRIPPIWAHGWRRHYTGRYRTGISLVYLLVHAMFRGQNLQFPRKGCLCRGVQKKGMAANSSTYQAPPSSGEMRTELI